MKIIPEKNNSQVNIFNEGEEEQISTHSPYIDNPLNKVKKQEIEDVSNPYVPLLSVQRLPSGFKSYKLIKIKPEISYKPYKFGQLKKINQSRLSTKQLFLEILSGIECNFDPLDLTLSDFLNIGLSRRLATFGGAKFNASFKCIGCNAVRLETFDYKSIDFNVLKCELPAIITIENVDLEFTPFTVRDYLFLYDLDLLEDSIAVKAIQCRNEDIKINYAKKDSNGNILDDRTRRFWTIYNMIYNLENVEDTDAIEWIDSEFEHSLKPVLVKCTNKLKDEEGKDKVCNAVNSLTLDGGGVIITPFREHGESFKSRVRFGKTTND